MLISLSCFFFLIWLVLYYRVRDVFAPWSITLLVWIGAMLGYQFVDHGLYSLTDQFYRAIVLWVVPFTVVGYIVFRLTPSYTGPGWKINFSIVRLLTVVALILCPYALYKAFTFALSSGGLNLMETMRSQVTQEDSGFSLGPVVYMVNVIFALLIVAADQRENYRPWFFWLCLMINIIFFLVLMSKIILFIGIFSSLYLAYVHKRVKLRTIGLTMVVFLIFGLVFTLYRSVMDGGDDDMTDSMMQLLGMYIFSPLTAFCYENPCTTPGWGSETFRPIYNILSALGLYHGQLTEIFRPFIRVPVLTNVYTMMAPFFNDFGYPGIAACASIEGAIVSWVYKKNVTGHTIARGLYAYLVVIILLQFFDDQFFFGISNILQMTILLYFTHLKFTWKPEQLSS